MPILHPLLTHLGGTLRPILDLSDKVFSAGMALSRVRSLAWLHLPAFDSKSITVSINCLEEVNRLRGAFRSDLPLY